MGRNSRRKWNRRRKLSVRKEPSGLVTNDVEQWSYGPISAVRRGRFFEMRSHWDPTDHKEFMKALKEGRPDLKKEVDTHITSLLDRIRPLDRVALSGALATALQSSNEENFGENSPARFSHAEFFVGLALSEPLVSPAIPPTAADVQFVIDTIQKIMDGAMQYYGSEIAEKGDQGAITELRFLMQLHTLNVRGDAYPQHLKALTVRLLKAVEPFFQKHFSLTAIQVWDVLEGIGQGVQGRINQYAKEALEPIFRSHAAYGKWVQRQDLRKFKSVEEVREAFANSGLAPSAEESEKFQEYMELFGGAKAFKHVPADENERRFVESLSTEFGANTHFTSIKNWGGWPLNPSVVYDYPLVKCQGEYFAFLVPRLLSDTPHIIDRLIYRTDSEYYNTSYLEKRGKVLEQYAMDLLKTALSPSQSLSGVYYTPQGQGRTELDGLLVVGDSLVLLEAKAGSISEAARRGAPKGLREDVQETIGAAFNQGQRALSYIDSAPEVPFFDEKGNELIRIRKADFRQRFILNVTMSPLYVLGTALPKLKDIGAIVGRDWPWAVYICDLAAIVELTTHPTILLHYLKRRLAANGPALSNLDELDLYGYYLKSGLYFAKGELDDPNKRLTFTGYTEVIDDYFFYKAGIKSKPSPMPKQDLPDLLELLLNKLETLQPPGYVTACLSLLDWDGPTRNALVKGIRVAENKHRRDTKTHNIVAPHEDSVLYVGVSSELPTEVDFNAWAQKWLAQGKTQASMLTWVGPLKRTTRMSFWSTT